MYESKIAPSTAKQAASHSHTTQKLHKYTTNQCHRYTLPRDVSCSIQHTRLVCGNHVLDVDKRVGTAVSLKCLQCFVNQVTHILAALLAVIDAITSLHYKVSEVYENGVT